MLAATLAGCSGDEDQDSDESAEQGTDAQPADGTEETVEPIVGDQSLICTAKVDVSGAVTLSWKQPGEAIVKSADSEGDGPLAFYRSTNPNGKTMVLLYSEGPNFEPSVTLSSNGTNFSTVGTELTGLEASSDGSEVTADKVTVRGTDGKKKAQVSATFTCGEKAGKKGDKKN
ncbi:hypothetical protein [Nocardioides salsibiostraticola]